MSSHNLLKKQVRAEIRKRRYVFYTLIFLSLLYIAISFIFGETGVLKLRELKQKEVSLEKEVAELKRQNENLKTSIDLYTKNEFYMERHAREEFGLAKPDEYIFLYER